MATNRQREGAHVAGSADDNQLDKQLLTRASLNGLAYSRLCADLKAGRFVPGDKLKLRDVAAELGISPTPVREALARLISEQALEQVGHHSVCVPLMSDARLSEIFCLRRLLEGEAALRAAGHATRDDIAALETIHRTMAARREAGDGAGARVDFERFHMGVYRLARMPVLLRMIESLWLQCGPLMHAHEHYPMSQPRRQHPHLAILRGLRRGDGELARKGLHEELDRTAASMLAYVSALAGRGPQHATQRAAARVDSSMREVEERSQS